jgi:hypothetical protein
MQSTGKVGHHKLVRQVVGSSLILPILSFMERQDITIDLHLPLALSEIKNKPGKTEITP